MKFKIIRRKKEIGIQVVLSEKFYLKDDKIEFSYLDAKKILCSNIKDVIIKECTNSNNKFITNAVDDHPSSFTWWFNIFSHKKPKATIQKTQSKPNPKPRKKRATSRQPRKKTTSMRERMKNVSEKILSEREGENE